MNLIITERKGLISKFKIDGTREWIKTVGHVGAEFSITKWYSSKYSDFYSQIININSF